MGSDGGYVPLFETKRGKGLVVYRLFAASVFVGIVLIWIYRATHIPRPGEDGRLGWIGLLAAELWFGFYWILTQSHRWNLTYRRTFKERLSQRFESELPAVDVFVCTADPDMEPPMMVINTVLSVMAYDYPPEKLSVYLSDDAGSDLTFYSLLEASRFSKHWLPFCKKFGVEPRSPAAYFTAVHDGGGGDDNDQVSNLSSIKKLYEEMEDRITTAAKLGRIPDNLRLEHKGFSQWNSFSSREDHDTILQILIDGRDPNAKDIEGCVLPTLVYLAREKRPHRHHNFKAGAMNALIRVSSELSNGEVILNVDCDMYSNNSQSIRDALCFFMDEKKGHEIAFVQYPQCFNNLTKNEVYGGSFRVIIEVEFHGIDGIGGPLYGGTGCFHRREVLCGRKFSKESRLEWKTCAKNRRNTKESANELEEKLKGLASCTYEDNTQWGKEMGLKYGCAVEDVITGLSIQCRGWKSAYYNPARKAFLGLASTTLDLSLIQHKRWSEGDFQIFLSEYNPLRLGHGRINLALQMAYSVYCLWAPNCLATLFYSVIPSLYLLRGTALFPQVSSRWFWPFSYVIAARYCFSLAEFLWSGGTVLGWWNTERMWLHKRTTSYLFATTDAILRFLGLSETSFVLTKKVTDPDVTRRYEQEMMEFGSDFAMFTILATLAMLNLICLGSVMVKRLITVGNFGFVLFCEAFALQVLLCGALVLVSLPLYAAAFVRKDGGKLPSSVTTKAILVAVFVCTCSVLLP
ncbi:Cellulose synthase (UDP-forming) [Bertholletia excelsa]